MERPEKHPDIHDFLNDPGLSIIQLCRLNNMTQDRLAELADMSTCQISRIINEAPDSKTSSLKKIAYVFGILRRPDQND